MGAKEDMFIARRKIAIQNKKRSANMERRIARVLGGKRVPMSGAGSLKGDGMVNSDYGLYLVECKMTSKTKGGINFDFITKLDKDVKSMNARFGIVIFHFHLKSTDYCIIREKWYKIFDEIDPDSYVYQVNAKVFTFNAELLDKLFQGKKHFLIDNQFVGRLVFFKLTDFVDMVKSVNTDYEE